MGDMAEDALNSLYNDLELYEHDYWKHWTTIEGDVIAIADMETRHLFNSTKMVYNGIAQAFNLPTVWFKENVNKDLIEDMKRFGLAGDITQHNLIRLSYMLQELKKRNDLASKYNLPLSLMLFNLKTFWKSNEQLMPIEWPNFEEVKKYGTYENKI